MGRHCFARAGLLALLAGSFAGAAFGSTRLLYWNIQDGMWDGQADNFDRFVEWVNRQSPDICVFAEVRTKRQTGTTDHVRDESQRILPKGWPELAARYGHGHVWISSDNPKCYMQGITSRFPIESVAKDLVPTGSGWARIRVGTNVLNIVTVHLNWTPWGRGCKTDAERKASAANFGGDLARRDEIETVLNGSFFTVPDASNQLWVVAGDYNARSPVDARMYDFPPDSPRYAVHRWLAESTPLVDALHEWLPNDFHVTCGAKSRIDYVYMTRALYDRMTEIRVVVDRYTRPTYAGVGDIWRPSDHRPILVDFDCDAVRYTPDVASRKQVRGVMLSQYTVCEDDFKTLKEWGATVARYQMYPVGERWKGNTSDAKGFADWLDWKLGVLKGEALPLARKYGIPLVVDLHVPPGGRGGSGMKMLDDPAWADFFVDCWRKISSQLKDEKGVYAYDLINEPTQFGQPKVCDYLEIQRRAAEAIRKIDGTTPIVVSCRNDEAWCAPSAFKWMKPIDLPNVFYQFHMYEPFDYTHQKVLPQFKETVAAYPDSARGWDAEGLRRIVAPVREFERRYGARIFVGEFSAAAYAKGCDRWIADVGALLNEYGWDWCYHAFREWPGWSVEHVVTDGDSAASAKFAPSDDNPRRRALLSALSGAGGWKVPRWSPVLMAPDAVKKVIDGRCSGHSQGMCVTSNALYFSFHNQIVKTDWKGRFLNRVEVVPHGGDICHWNGRVYVGVWEPPKKKGEKGCTAIKVYDAETLEPVKERRMPEWQNAADGITCLDGVIILAMGMKDWNGSDNGHANYFGKFDAETLEPVGKPFVVDHGEESSCGAQNICTDGMYIYACYYTSDEAARTPNFIVFDRDFKVVGKHLFGWTHGVDVVPGGRDGAVRFAWATTLNNNWDMKSPVVPQMLVQFGELKDGKIADITKYIGFKKPMAR